MLKHKYHAKKTIRDGLNFPSRLEAKHYDQLKTMQAAGEILFFLRQIPFDLPGNTKYRADFMLFFTDGHVEIWDSKGVLTTDFIMKKKVVEALYPVEIKIVK